MNLLDFRHSCCQSLPTPESKTQTAVDAKTHTRADAAQVNRKDQTQYLGKINLIDLAGSENVNKSGVQGRAAVIEPKRKEDG